MKKTLLLVASFLAGAGLFVWITKAVGFEEIKESLAAFSYWKLLVIILLTFLMAGLGILKWREILKGEGVSISFKSLISPYLGGYALMLLAPIIVWGGEMIKAYILKEKNQVPWPKGMASVVIDRMLEVTVNLVVIIFGASIFISKIYRLPPKLELFFGIIFLLFAAGTFYFYAKVFRKESFIKSFTKAFGFKKISQNSSFLEVENEIFSFFRLNNKPMWRAVILAFIRTGVIWLRVWLLIFFLEKPLGLFPGLSILGFAYLATLSPIPAALGSHEAVQILVFTGLGLGSSSAMAFAMIIRVAEVLTALLGVLALFRFGVYSLKKIFFKKVVKLTNGFQDAGDWQS